MKKTFETSTLMKAINGEEGPLLLIETGDWITDGKYERCETILVDKAGLFWRFYQWMSGSPYTDYYHWYEDIKEMELEKVEHRERVEKYWSAV